MVPKKTKPRNRYAKELGNPLFRQQKIKSVKQYDRKKIKPEDVMADKQFDSRKHSSICGGCAVTHGGVWPEGHQATQWSGQCSVCEKEDVDCCDVTDWSWPEHKWGPGEREF